MDGTYCTPRIRVRDTRAINLGGLPNPTQKPLPPIAIPSSSPDSASVKVAGRKGWSVISGGLLSARDLASHWASYRQGCQEAGRVASGKDWRVCRSIHVAATDEEARGRVYSAESGYRHFYGHMHKVYGQLGRLGLLKSRPDMRDDEVTVETFIEQRTIFGSPKTVQSELAALRREAGPFGTLLLTTVDWAGPNAAWERGPWTRLTQAVGPALRP